MPDPLKQSISATESPALFNVSPYLTRWMLYKRFRDGLEIAKEQDNRMSWGKRMQPLVLAAAVEDLKLEIRPNASDLYVRNGQLGCTRDAEIICPDRGPGAIETKCVFDYSIWMQKWNGGKNPPHEHEIQLQQQMKVGDGTTPYKWGVLAAWCGGEVFYFERKPVGELWENLVREAGVFFEDVAHGVEPPPFGDPVESKLLIQCFPTIKGSVLDLSLDGLDPVADEDEIKRRVKLAEEAAMLAWHSESRLGHARAEKKLKAQAEALALGNETVLLPHGCKIMVKQQSRAAYSVNPTTFKVVDVYVPPDAPRGNVLGLEPTEGRL